MTSTDHEAQDREVDKNFDYFQTIVEELEKTDAGRYALLKDQQIITIHDTLREALTAGHEKYGSAPFSVQEVVSAPLDLGALSHVNFL